MATLPDPTTLPLFQHVARDGSARALTGCEPDPRVITEYVFSSSNWRKEDLKKKAKERSKRAAAAAGGGGGGGGGWRQTRAVPTTVDDILSRAAVVDGGGDGWLCTICGRDGGSCAGGACVDAFRDLVAAEGAASVEVREVGGAGLMGMGVFATWRISAGMCIGEYLGELLPASTDEAEVSGDKYLFQVPGVGYVTSKQYGNWTRFVNHRCINNNVTAMRVMYGKRVVMMFVAVTDIQPGDQLFIDYGRPFFESQGIMCECDDITGRHLPPPPGKDTSPGTMEEPGPTKEAVAPARQGDVSTGKDNLRAVPSDSADANGAVRLVNAETAPAGQAPAIQTTGDGENVLIRIPADATTSFEPLTLDFDVSCGGHRIAHKEVYVDLGQGGKGPVTIDIDVYLDPKGGGGGGGQDGGLAPVPRHQAQGDTPARARGNGGAVSRTCVAPRPAFKETPARARASGSRGAGSLATPSSQERGSASGVSRSRLARRGHRAVSTE